MNDSYLSFDFILSLTLLFVVRTMETHVFSSFYYIKIGIFSVQVSQALRRLEGTNNWKGKLSAKTKLLFDQLTEDAMKLLENGGYS